MAAFAVASIALASGFAAWIADFDPVAWTREPAFVKGATASFDDRFAAGPELNSASISYPSRPIVSSVRLDFGTEFEHIEGLLAEQSRDAGTGPSDQSTPSDQATLSDRPTPSDDRSTLSAAAAIPLPKSRPVEADLQLKTDPLPAPSDSRTLLQKLADLVPPRLKLASLTPNDGLFGERPDLGALGYDNLTAVYDISAHAVYMPNGSKLEAHSGLGHLMDDPGHVNERNVGATPPNVYDLKPREQLFHGVQALRMIPVGENDTLGRSGLLAHSYMLGPNGQSNGCVSIKDYDRFLSAFKNGEIKRLVVVPSLGEGLPASRRST